MKSVTVDEAQADLPQVLPIVEGGEGVKLIRRKKAVAKLVPVSMKGKGGPWERHFEKIGARRRRGCKERQLGVSPRVES